MIDTQNANYVSNMKLQDMTYVYNVFNMNDMIWHGICIHTLPKIRWPSSQRLVKPTTCVRPAYDLRPLYNKKQTYKPKAQSHLHLKPNNQPSSPNSSVGQPATKAKPRTCSQRPISQQESRRKQELRPTPRLEMSALSCPAQMLAHVKLQRKQPFGLTGLTEQWWLFGSIFQFLPDFNRFNSLGPVFDLD